MSKHSRLSSSTASTSTIVHQDNSNLPNVLGRHSSHDCYFDIKIIQAEPTTFRGRPAYELQFKLDFARPFDVLKRIRSAAIDIKVASRRPNPRQRGPSIVGIDPEASLVYMADHEIASGQNVGVNLGAPGPAAGAINVSAGLSWGDKTTFKGSRLIHGFLPAPNKARWKMYEEPKSKSGLPPSVRLMVIVEADTSFCVSADVRVQRWSGWGAFGVVKSIDASPTVERFRGYVVRHKPAPDPSESAFKASDNITKILRESEGKMQALERVIDQHFPQLNFNDLYGPDVALLRLRSLNHLFDWKQINVPFRQSDLILGRQSGKAVATQTNGFFESRTMSRRHAAVWADEDSGKVYIMDIGSRSGTFVNGQQLSKGKKREIHNNDELQLGTDFMGDDRRSIQHPRILARVDFAGLLNTASTEDTLDRSILTIHETKKLNARKTAMLQDIDKKFDVWRMMAEGEEQENMINALYDVVDHRLEELGLDPFRDYEHDAQESGESGGEDDSEEDEDDEDDHNDEPDDGDRPGHGDADEDAGEVDEQPGETRPSRRASGRSYERRRYEPEIINPTSMRFVRSREYGLSTRVNSGSRSYPRRSRDAGSAKILLPKVQTAEEALANHRTVGRDWKEVKL